MRSSALIDRSQPPAPAPVREFHFPDVERSALPNQLAVLSARRPELPVVTLMLVARAGAEHDTRAHAGRAYLTARALEAGTATRSADRVAWEFEMLGAELDVSVLWDCATLSVTVPSNRAEPALALLSEVVLNPGFLDSEIDRLIGEQLSELEQRRAEPRALASDMAARFVYAPDVPYARPTIGTPAAVRNLTVDHVRAFYEASWKPGNSALIAVGDVAHAQVERWAARHLDPWQPRATGAVEFDIASPIERTQIFLVDRDAAVQSEMRVGHVGVARSTPDYFPLVVANGVLGGVFTSRLNMSLREEHGYTYGVRSGFAFRKHAGPFTIQTAVATDVTAAALAETLAVTRKYLEDGPSESETVAARDYLAGVLPLQMQTTDEIADRVSDIFVYGLADDYLPQHRGALLSVQPDEAHQAARDRIRPDQLAIVIVGDAKAIESDLAALELGPIEVHSADE